MEGSMSIYAVGGLRDPAAVAYLDASSVKIDVDRTRRLIDVAERRVLLETSRDRGEQ
jgi:hypothetical protein